jgi:hypothetical protein
VTPVVGGSSDGCLVARACQHIIREPLLRTYCTSLRHARIEQKKCDCVKHSFNTHISKGLPWTKFCTFLLGFYGILGDLRGFFWGLVLSSFQGSIRP